MTEPVTGDLTRRKSYQTAQVSIPFTQVLAADLADKDSELNQEYLSGKQAGAGFITEDFVLYIAAGPAPTDKWISQRAAASDITPAEVSDPE